MFDTQQMLVLGYIDTFSFLFKQNILLLVCMVSYDVDALRVPELLPRCWGSLGQLLSLPHPFWVTGSCYAC